jgi:AAA15 family ATPase/GTPase
MLLRFGVSNYRSIRDYQELLLTASKLKDRSDHLFVDAGIREPILPVVALYGANASGKSNLLLALFFMRMGVLRSHTRDEIGAPIGRQPFRLDPACKSEPTRFDVDFLLAGVRYHYGFVISSERVEEEWLYAYPNGRRQLWFHRDAADSEQAFQFGKNLGGRNRVIESLTRTDSLFLSVAAQNNHAKLLPLYNFFAVGLLFRLSPLEAVFPVGIGAYGDPGFRDRAVAALRSADFGIESLSIEREKIPDEVQPMLRELDSLARSNQLDLGLTQDSTGSVETLGVGHRGKTGENVTFTLRNESSGTQTLIKLLPIIFHALDSGALLVVDELEASMHPLLARRVLEMFSDPTINRGRGQLIFTTHNSELLSENLLRRDQVWFTEKDPEGATSVYSLSDYHTRSGDNHEQAYLQGRYGAVPVLGRLDQMVMQGEA